MGLMMAEFDNQRNKHRVVLDGLWNFDKCLMLVKDFDCAQQVKNICLKEASFWERVHDILLMACNDYIGKTVDSMMGRVEEVDLDYREVEWGELMQIMVSIYITKPLL